ncbi:AAA family ATPase [Duganella sp. P38]|uniref:AAA family ATPase n=1 Tax=Duganella sp. P38 TaxID=3423949 RepID=UPI003D79490F
MDFFQIRIKNYRSIVDEISLGFGKKVTLIGPNNSGKTNIVNAIQAFFSGIEENSYQIKRDLPVNFGGKQTSIIASFSADKGKDAVFLKLYAEMQNCLEAENRQDDIFQIYLYYSSTGKPVYQFFPNVKIKNKLAHSFKTLHQRALRLVLASFCCKSIPSVKDPSALFSTILLPFIKKSVALVLEPHLPKIKSQLDEISNGVNSVLSARKLPNIKTAFDISETIENTLSNFDFQIDDGLRMSAKSKGSGLQAAAILASLKWIGAEEKKLAARQFGF